MQHVLVVDSNRQPRDPVHPAQARQWLKVGQAAVLRRYPFTLILKVPAVVETPPQSLRLKIDPGSRTTGIAVVQETTGKVVWAAEIEHRGQRIKAALDARRSVRRSRRARHTRYRAPRFDNRRRDAGWLPPSQMSRVANVETWVKRLTRFAPIEALSLEWVKFDTQLMVDPNISGIEYQRGELAGYEVREYLLEKWGRKCVYCGAVNVPLQIEHLTPKSRGGSNRVSNLTLACGPCNQRKGAQTAAEFGHPEVQKQAQLPLKDAAAMNATRWAQYRRLQMFDLPIECGTGGRTKFNRLELGLPKAHWIDAACVGASGAKARVDLDTRPLLIRATGHGSRQMCSMDKYGFPRTGPKQARQVHGFKTGDQVKAIVPNGKRAGTHVGRVVIRASGSFNITVPTGMAQGIGWRCCRLIQHADGFTYSTGGGASSTR